MRTKVALLALLVICVTGLATADKQNKFGVADQRQITFYEQVKVGDTVLPAGEYKVLHTMEGDNHVMVFQQLNVGKKNQATAKVQCNLKTLAKAADQSLIGYKNENTPKVLNFLQFKGDTAVHQF
jgi:hypothetical protein